MRDNAGILNIHAVIPASRVNGPGARLVVFFQGCERLCPGCFNPDTHAFEMRRPYAVQEVFERHLSGSVEGITVSGGEPFMQARGLRELLECAQKEHGLSTVVYTGFRLEEVEDGKEARAALPFIDLLVDGAYDEARPEPTLLARGSMNQRFHFLTSRYGLCDMYMPARAELSIGPGGVVTGTGFSRVFSLPTDIR